MSSARSLTIGLLVAIILVRWWFNGHLGASLGALVGPVRPLGAA